MEIVLGLVALAVLILVATAAGTPSPPAKKPRPKVHNETDAERPEIAHPWASGFPNEIDDFAGPHGIYGPKVPAEDE